MSARPRSLEEAIARSRRASQRITRVVACTTVFLPTFASVAAVGLAVAGMARPAPAELIVMALLYVCTMLGITVGFHRLFAHRAFSASRAARLVLGILGSMSAQGSLNNWVSEHRVHHRFSDKEGDPHSPSRSGAPALHLLRRTWHAHTGWMLAPAPTKWHGNIADLFHDRIAWFVSRWYFAWVLLGLLIPALAALMVHGSWKSALTGVLWGGFVRIFLGHHATWSVNSLCHLVGRRPFRTNDDSRNNLFVAIVAMGEGWHNNHHAFPASARHGLRWWEVDLSYCIIRALCLSRLARDVRTANPTTVSRCRV